MADPSSLESVLGPVLTSQFTKTRPGSDEAANILRQALSAILSDRSSGLVDGKPEGKKRAVYALANLQLKTLFQSRKSRHAAQVFEPIQAYAPPLAAYPKRDRVTYLYYLGRYQFEQSHFYRAQLALQQAYDESPSSIGCTKQKRIILVYLITANLIMGRFPSPALFERPEAQGFQERFGPIILAIKKGNIAAFRLATNHDSPYADWFWGFKILLQIQNRCEVLVWRSLVRKTWLLAGTHPDPNSKIAPNLSIATLVAVFTALEKQVPDPLDGYVHPDWAGLSRNIKPVDPTKDARAIESKLGSLITQGLVRGFIAHKAQKYVITGSKAFGGNALAAGFPQPWAVITDKADKEVPGWKREANEDTAQPANVPAIVVSEGASSFGGLGMDGTMDEAMDEAMDEMMED